MAKGNHQDRHHRRKRRCHQRRTGLDSNLVQLFNVTDGTLITCAFLSWVVPFTSGGTATIVAGSTIRA